MTKADVREALGPPPKTLTYIDRPDPSDGEDRWWLYPVPENDRNIAWIYFGFGGDGRVERIEHGISLGGPVREGRGTLPSTAQDSSTRSK
jgi:hypothetical protein